MRVMTQRIILISGFGGSGKSTCAQLLWNQLENAALVEADHLFRIKPFEMNTEEGHERIGRVKLQNSLAVTETFMAEKFENIIVEGLVWSQMELDMVTNLAATGGYKVWCFWLKTSKEERHKRALSRERDEADSQAFLDLVEETIRDPTPLSLPDGHYYEITTDHCTAKNVVSEMRKMMDRRS